MASPAEARIRTKAEALLRREWPDARIIHEFDLGGVRLDLAAVTPERLIMLEIKSENDTLTRLKRQAEAALSVGGPVLVGFAPRWREAIHRTGLWGIEWIEETDDELSIPYPMRLRPDRDRYCNRSLMRLLLKPELLALAKPFGARTKHTVDVLHHLVHENLTGREIRIGAMAALRARHFGWTCDPPTPTPDQAKAGEVDHG